jgi:endonuclease-8
VPEGDTIYRAARTLNSALAGHTVTQFESVLPKLMRVDVDQGLTGRTIERVEASGKWPLMYFSGDLILVTHMLMSGSWHIYRPGERWRLPRQNMRVMIATENIVAVAFNIQVAEFHTPGTLRRRPGFSQLGPSVLGPDFDVSEGAIRLLASKYSTVGDALLRQSVVAGIGNVYKSEICFACRVHPFRIVASLSKQEATGLMSTAAKFMRANIAGAGDSKIVTYAGLRRTTGRANPAECLWVYGRRGSPCRRCGTPIESAKQGLDARTTFWCPECQKLDMEAFEAPA